MTISPNRAHKSKNLESYTSDEEEDDMPLSQASIKKRRRVKINDILDDDEGDGDEDEDEDATLSSIAVKNKKQKISKIKVEEFDGSSSSQEKKVKKSKKKSKKVSKKMISDPKNETKQESDDDDKPLKKEVSTELENDEEEEYKWWEKQNEDDSIKWTTLKHNGVLLPPPYEPLPSHVKLYYEGKPVDLPLEAEEVAGFFGAMLETDHAKNPTFQKNFFTDFLHVLEQNGGTKNGIEIKEFTKCDFKKIFDYYDLQREATRQKSSLEKKQIRLEREKAEEKYKFCELDGRKEQVGNFKVEPPGLFRGRGAHPKTGKLKRRVQPEDIVLNLSEDAPIPEAPAGHQWGEVRHDNTVQWLAMWKENIFNSLKYVRLAANSSLKGQNDLKKFEKARQLKDHIDTIRKDYRKRLKNKFMLERQKATAIYLIDVFALRAGGEKSEEEADTVGCCSLRYEHVTLKPPNTVIFDFLGKDSIRYYQQVEVDKQVFKDLTIFKRPPKQPGHQLFDRLDPSILNKHLQSYMPGLTAKVFRTYNASKTMQDQLDLIPNEGTVAEKLLRYNAANRTVAILCNHQRTVTKGHAQSVEKANMKIKELEWQKIRLKRGLLQLDSSELKKNKAYFKELDDLSKEDEASIHAHIIERERDRLHKKFARENDKKKFMKEKELPESELKEWLDKVEEKKKQYAKELKTNVVELRSSLNTVEKIKAQIEKLEQRILTATIQLKDKEENSEVSLGTSKLNYIDPRLNVAFCKKYNVPIEKIFTKTLRDKFKWAIESADENWRF
ncbi:DNA topoisomerase 1 NDAI_0C02690 [Naumovozyma dairenensis CBS 421]|uniref:DNA topoisomerase I n=1 Tax=Naumovozyma dairenensis (strain ATCC 10597 / BCRC 20456 / CBS 421 / NBRC 0211 / NRRL Y-12639) TaxID=1071378 RepID=G0W818_NAUDC|nr:hypothetical protein NDAI_0C02690 [Naumovozyma dairenensis CBS 421]CCD23929.1 hypothetical protein NDAI_0C02690 [Naumovozyma dairenensis CBS 421]